MRFLFLVLDIHTFSIEDKSKALCIFNASSLASLKDPIKFKLIKNRLEES